MALKWPRWSIFGSDPLPVAVARRLTDAPVAVAAILQTLKEAGATVQRVDKTSFSGALPVRKFVGFGYRRRLTIACHAEIQQGSNGGTELTIECDAAALRKSKRALFYLWSVFFVAVSVPRIMTNGWDLGIALFLFSPWPAVEGNFLYDRWRLRWKLQRVLDRLSGG